MSDSVFWIVYTAAISFIAGYEFGKRIWRGDND